MDTNGLTAAASHDPACEWEETDCPMCGSRRWAPVLHRRRPVVFDLQRKVAVVECEHCGLRFTNPRPRPECIGRFYPSDYLPHQPKPPRRSPRPRLSGLLGWASRLARFRLDRLVLPRFGQGRLLDFGCGSGAFLQQMHAQGWHVTGLDFSPNAVKYIVESLGLPCLQGTLPHPDLRPESVEVVTMWSSLEHVHQPLETLRQVHRLLVPGGRLIVSVPNIRSLPFRWFGAAWFGLDLPRHLTHFSVPTLRLMLEQAGFNVTDVRMSWHSEWTQTSAKTAVQGGLAPFWLGWFQSRRLASLLGRYCLWTRQTDDIVLMATKPVQA